MLYCGLDVHKETITGCIIDKEGIVIKEHTFPCNKESILAFLTSNAEIEIAIEACGIWRGAYKILKELGYRVKLADPRKVHDIAGKKKTDKGDARILADLLRTDYLPEVFIPEENMLKLRDLTRHKANLTRLRVKVQVKIRGYLMRDGLDYKNIWKKEVLKELAEKDPNLRNLINVYYSLKEEEKEVMRRIRRISKSMKLTNLLMTVPGIGEYSALLILAEIGDIRRFKTPKQLISYAGLCPGIYQSGSKERKSRFAETEP